MIGQFVQKLHQGVAPQRSMANGGGSGGGSSGTPYYANQDKLFGAQADIAQNLYNQYASLAPGYLQNSLDMTNEAMDGTLADKMRQQAGNDAAAANGNSWDAANRNMSRMGANFSTDRMLSEMNKNSIMGAANMTGALNNATSAAEDQKWNRNAGAYGQIAGMGNGAMQGMGSAASGYGQMSGQIASNNAANAAGYGKFGAAMAAGSKWADGGYIEKPGLKLAQGAYVRGSQSVYKPAGYQQQVLSMPSADWRNQQTSGSYGGSKPVNPALAILGGAAPYMLGAGLKEYGAPAAKDLWKSGKEALMREYDDYRAQQAEYDAAAQADASAGYTGAEAFGTQGGGADTLDWAAQDTADEAWLNDGFANGGYIRKPGLRFATGGYAQPISGDYESDPYRYRGHGMSQDEMVARQVGNVGLHAAAPTAMKSAYNYATAPDPSKSFVSSTPETPGVATTTPVADSGAGVTASTLPEASTGAGATTTETGATSGATAAETGATSGATAVETGAATGAAETGTAAGTAAAGTEAATAAGTIGAAAETGAALSTAGEVALAAEEAAPLLLLLANGGQARGLQRSNMKPGGKVAGPGTETSDDIPAWLSDGEFVLNKAAVDAIGRDKLEKLNQLGLNVRNGKLHPGKAKDLANKGLKLKGVQRAKAKQRAK